MLFHKHKLLLTTIGACSIHFASTGHVNPHLSYTIPTPPGLKVTVQKFPEGMTTGCIPTSCLTSPKSSKGRRGSAQQQQQREAAAERRWRFTSDELARIQEQLDEILMHSNPNSKSTPSEPPVCQLSNSREVCFTRLVILSLMQAGCPAACPPAARCPMCPALGVPRRGTAPGSAASGPGNSSAHRCQHRARKRTYLRHKHARSPACIHTCLHVRVSGSPPPPPVFWP